MLSQPVGRAVDDLDQTDAQPLDQRQRGRSWRAWGAILLLTLLVRGGVLAARFSALRADPDGYRMLAEHLTNDGVFGRPDSAHLDGPIYPSAYRPPLYPLTLAPLVIDGRLSLGLVAALHLAWGMATVAVTVFWGQRLGMGWRAFAAGALVACDPLLVNQSTLVMTETLAALLAVALLTVLDQLRRRGSVGVAALAGGVLGLAALCRPTFLPFVTVVVVLGFAGALGGHSLPQRARRVVVVTLVAACVIGPWALRNHAHFGRFIATTTHGGYTLLLGNNPGFYEYLRANRWGETWAPESIRVMLDGCQHAPDGESSSLVVVTQTRHPGDELAEDEELNACAWRHMRHDPWGAVRASLYRVGQLWSPLAHRQSPHESLGQKLLRWGAAGWYVVVEGAALVFLLRSWRRVLRGPWLAGLLLCLLFTSVHALYWSNLRMRAPLMPLVALLACAAPRDGQRRCTTGPKLSR